MHFYAFNQLGIEDLSINKKYLMLIGYSITNTTIAVCISCHANMVDDSLTWALLKSPEQF